MKWSRVLFNMAWMQVGVVINTLAVDDKFLMNYLFSAIIASIAGYMFKLQEDNNDNSKMDN